jgi:hypothetical protein
MRMYLKVSLALGLMSLIASPAHAQWATPGNWDQYQFDRSSDNYKTLCRIKRGARIVENVANALLDDGGFNYGNWGGGYRCQNYRSNYQERYVPQYQNSYPYRQQYRQYETNDQWNAQPYRSPTSPGSQGFSIAPILPSNGRLCVQTQNGFTIC